jgi:hypothetical protein
MERDSNRTRLVMVVSENLGIEVPGFPPSVGKSGRSPKTPSGWIGKGGLRTVNVMLSELVLVWLVRIWLGVGYLLP